MQNWREFVGGGTVPKKYAQYCHDAYDRDEKYFTGAQLAEAIAKMMGKGNEPGRDWEECDRADKQRKER